MYVQPRQQLNVQSAAGLMSAYYVTRKNIGVQCRKHA